MNCDVDLNVRPLTPTEVDTAIDWARDEGWNPGLHDRAAFMAVDPGGFWGGFVGGTMVGCISVVNYDPSFAFLGFYIVQPDYRGRGYGYQIWQRAIDHADDRTIGLDGVVAQQANYEASGFSLAWRNIRYKGTIAPSLAKGGAKCVALSGSQELRDFDRRFFPARRDAFLDRWINAPGTVARGIYGANGLQAYGVIRACVEGHKVGPLFARDKALARTVLADLLHSVAGGRGGGVFFLDVPEPNAAAKDLVGEFAMSPAFETARMYKGRAPELDLNGIFGISTFELG